MSEDLSPRFRFVILELNYCGYCREHRRSAWPKKTNQKSKEANQEGEEDDEEGKEEDEKSKEKGGRVKYQGG